MWKIGLIVLCLHLTGGRSNTISESPKMLGLEYNNITVHKTFPSEPMCDLSISLLNTKPVFVEIWKYQLRDSHQYGFDVKRREVKTKCHVTLFGGTEKTILSIEDTKVDKAIVFSSDFQNVANQMRNGSFQEPLPRWECSYWADTILTQIIYSIKRVLYEYDPNTKGFLSPVGISTDHADGVYQLGEKGLFVTQEKNPHFDPCHLEIFKTGAGTLFLYQESIHQLSLNQYKEMYYVDEIKAFQCNIHGKKISIYRTLGGYLLSYTFLNSLTTTSIINSSHTMNPLPGGEGVGLITGRKKRDTPQDVTPTNDSSPTISESSNVPFIFPCSTENFLRNQEENTPGRYSTTLGSECGELSRFRAKRDIPIHETSSLELNYQHTLSRTELQWGLYHLANLTSTSLTQLSREICLNKLDLHRQLTQDVFIDNRTSLHVGSFYPDITIYNATYKEGEIIIKLATEKEISLFNPLQCCERYCKVVSDIPKWVESSTKKIITINPCQKTWFPKSFMVQDAKTKNWVDLITNLAHAPLYSLKVLQIPSLLEYSFQSVPLYTLSELANSQLESTSVNNGTGIIKSKSGFLSFGFVWISAVINWFSSVIGKCFLSLGIFFGLFLIMFLLGKWILSIKVNRKPHQEYRLTSA